MKSVDEALAEILQHASVLPAEPSALHRARTRVLATELRASRTLPPFDNSEMDGYAVRAADLREVPCALPIAETVAAGHVASGRLAPGTAARIFTGAPLPEGADAVVKQEDVVREGERVRFERAVRAGAFVRPRGSDLALGDLALAAGTRLGAAELGLAAALGVTELAVVRRPVVAVLSTGDELVEPDVPLGPGQIVNSNAVALAAALEEAGAVPKLLGIARDERAHLEAKLRDAADADVLLTVGGVSVGERDFVKEVLAHLGWETRFWRVNVKPGKPLLFGRWPVDTGVRLVFGLPGNPASAMVTFELFVRPALLRMSGLAHVHRPRVHARLTAPIHKRDERRHFVRGHVSVAPPDAKEAAREGRAVDSQAPQFHATPLAKQSSGALTSMVGANALLVVPEDVRALAVGDTVEVVLLGEWSASEVGGSARVSARVASSDGASSDDGPPPCC